MSCFKKRKHGCIECKFWERTATGDSNCFCDKNSEITFDPIFGENKKVLDNSFYLKNNKDGFCPYYKTGYLGML